MMSRHSSAARCALLFGTPVTREQFDEAAAERPLSDYMMGVLRGNDPAVSWERDYAPVMRAAARLIETARAVGARVYDRSTLKDFTEATRFFQYVVLLAHWRGVTFRRRDFSDDLAAILERMQRSSVLNGLRPEPRSLDDVVDVLNAAVESRSLLESLPDPLARAARASRAVGRALCRDLIDEALAGLVAPGNGVELFDGVHSPGEMEEALWSGFSGELDLSLCNSEVFAVYLDLRRQNRIGHLHWPDVLNPIPQCLLIAETLKRMATAGGGYIRTRLSVEEEL